MYHYDYVPNNKQKREKTDLVSVHNCWHFCLWFEGNRISPATMKSHYCLHPIQTTCTSTWVISLRMIRWNDHQPGKKYINVMEFIFFKTAHSYERRTTCEMSTKYACETPWIAIWRYSKIFIHNTNAKLRFALVSEHLGHGMCRLTFITCFVSSQFVTLMTIDAIRE